MDVNQSQPFVGGDEELFLMLHYKEVESVKVNFDSFGIF
jgi:hypothetical protein